MDQPVKEKAPGKPRILVAPLDWAWRCYPLYPNHPGTYGPGLRSLARREKTQEQLLRAEFPQLPFLDLPGYRIQYAKTAYGLFWKMIQQGPKFSRVIRQEHDWLKKNIENYRFDGVISDNRYGLYHPEIPSVFITHQLSIKSPLGKWTENILQKRNYRYINHFTECWIPDMAGVNNLAGELSHPVKKPAVPVYYVGPLSRLNIENEISYSPLTGGGKDHLLLLLSGPEPQRTLLENIFVNQISHYNGTATIVRGLPGSLSIIPSTNMIRFYNHLPAKQLAEEIQKADYVIGRCGYSTVMDLVKLNKKSILIPTPGQTEQEYLAAYLTQKKIVCSIPQKDFSLTHALEKARQFSYINLSMDNEHQLQQAISKFLSTLDHGFH